MVDKPKEPLAPKSPITQGATPADNQTPITPGPTQTVVISPAAPEPISSDSALSLPPTTTAQDDVTSAGQRKVNLIWEVTQSIIAVAIVGANITAALYNVFHGKDVDVPVMLSSALFMVLGFYLARTNHEKIGGVGPVPPSNYVGR